MTPTPRRVAAIVSALLLAPVVVACGPGSSGATGVVVKRQAKESRHGRDYYRITIREDWSGKTDTGDVSKKIGERCDVGDSWPSCKEEES